MQNILRWKFNLNFPAKFDLSVAGHQNWQRPAQLKYFMNIHKQLTILNNDQINTNFLWRTCFYGRNSVFEDDNMYFHICSWESWSFHSIQYRLQQLIDSSIDKYLYEIKHQLSPECWDGMKSLLFFFFKFCLFFIL